MAVPKARPPATDAACNQDSVEHLHRRIAELTEAVAARDAFIAVAGHDLRNAMTPMMGQVDLLLVSVAAGKCSLQQAEQRLGRVQHTMIRYLRRARILLDVSRLTGGKLRLHPEMFDLAALLRDVASDFHAASRLSGVALRVAAPESLMVTLDQPATEQIVSNLVQNALRYGARTPVEMSAAVSGEQVQIQVRDHGCGILAMDRSRVSGRFERTARQGDRDGFSVGLWIVGQFVAAMHGTVAIDDEPGGGTLFTISLPLHSREFPH